MSDQILEALEIGFESTKFKARHAPLSADGAHEYMAKQLRKIEAAIALYKSQKDDGWIAWNGGECPIALWIRVDVRLRHGYEFPDRVARDLRWSHVNDNDFNNGDIIAYKLSGSQHEHISR